jgi:hypothetical protein
MKLLLITVIATLPLWADKYVRDGGTSSACTSWTDACDQATTAIGVATRPETIWVADGTYNGFTFSKAESSTNLITLKKALAADHGTETGWVSTYGDGQASFTGGIVLTTGYLYIDGQQRNESDWSDAAAYGFKFSDFYTNYLSNGSVGNNLTVRYADVGGTQSATFSEGHPDTAFYLGGFSVAVTGWTVSHCYIHNVDLPFQMASADQILIEYNYIGPSWQKEIIRGQIRATNVTIKYNVMRDGCQAVAGDPPDGRVGCTAPIAIWDGNANMFDDGAIYGNVISTTKTTNYSDACIMIGGDGGATAAGSPANNWVVHNNTLAGVQSGTCTIRFNGADTNTVARNNIWYGLGGAVSTGCSAVTCSDNGTVTDIFVAAASGNFRLSQATTAGFSLSAPYDTDMDGATRGSDGTFDRGAFEFDSTPAGTPTQRMRGTARVSTGTVR